MRQLELAKKGGRGGVVGMPKPSMPKRDGNDHGVDRRRSSDAADSVHVVRTIEPSDHLLAAKILHRHTQGIKLNRNKVVNSEFTNRYQVFDKIGHNKNFTQR